MKNIAIYGFGGFGREIACLINQINEIKPEWQLVGFFDDGIAAGTANRYGKVLGNLEVLNSLSEELSVVIAIATPKSLRKVAEGIINPKIQFPNIFAPNTNFFDRNTLEIGNGNIFFFGCRLSCDVQVGDFNLMNGAVSLGHDVKLGSYNVLGPSTRISGDCTVGDENFFGVNSVVLQGLSVGNNTRIGAGSVVMRNTQDNFLYVGNPAKKIIL